MTTETGENSVGKGGSSPTFTNTVARETWLVTGRITNPSHLDSSLHWAVAELTETEHSWKTAQLELNSATLDSN